MLAEMSIWSAPVQIGFAAMSVLLFLFCVWLVRQLIKLLRESTKAIVRNNEVVQQVHAAYKETKGALALLAITMLKNPCLYRLDPQTRREILEAIRRDEDHGEPSTDNSRPPAPAPSPHVPAA